MINSNSAKRAMRNALVVTGLVVGMLLASSSNSYAAGDCPPQATPMSAISCVTTNSLSDIVARGSGGGSGKPMQMLSIRIVP